jgi:hypothetical protein
VNTLSEWGLAESRAHQGLGSVPTAVTASAVAISTVGGATTGALLGALVGLAVKKPGKGAMWGAGIGGASGLVMGLAGVTMVNAVSNAGANQSGSSGALTSITLSAGSAYAWWAPTGQVTGATSSNSQVASASVSGGTANILAAAQGSATVTIQWTDGNGAAQTTAVSVTVTA